MTQPLAPGAFAKALHDKRLTARRRKVIALAAGGGALLVAVVLVYLFWFSPVFATKTMQVNGVGLLSVDQVTSAAQVSMDVPVMRQDTDAISARVKALAPVRDVVVSRSLPSTIVIDVTERTLVYQLVVGNSVQWIDADGVAYHSTPEPTEGVIQVAANNPDERLRTDIATVVANIPESVRGQVSDFSAQAVDRITFRLSADREVVWGSAEESALKGQVLSALLAVDASTYDVSAPRNPITKK